MKGLKSVASVTSVRATGTQFNFMLSVPEDNRTGIFKFWLRAQGIQSARFVPADAVKFQRWRLDGQKTWTALQQILGDIIPDSQRPEFHADHRRILGQGEGPVFDIKKNLFGNLGDDMISYQKKPKGASLEEIGSPPSLFLLVLQSGTARQCLEERPRPVFAADHAHGPGFLGRKIYTLPLRRTGGLARRAT